jgi:hypothetical protein
MWKDLESFCDDYKTVKRRLRLIEDVAGENEYVCERFERGLRFYFDREVFAQHYTVEAYKSDHDATWLKVSVAAKQDASEDNGATVYSLRSVSDVVKFCQTLIIANEIKAKRRES